MSVMSRVRDGVTEITVEGTFSFDQHTAFRAATTEAVNQKARSIEVNLFEVNYLDSSALGMLLVLKEQAQAAGITQLAITGAKGVVKQVLDVAHFDKFFTLK